MGICEAKGWTKSHRRMECSPVWRHHVARDILIWLVWRAAPSPARERTPDGVVVLRRGQLFTTYDEMARRNYFSVDQVKRAFVILRNLETIEWESLRRGLLVTVVNYRQYQDRTPHGEDAEAAGDVGAAGRTETSTPDRTAESANRARQKNSATSKDDNGMRQGKTGGPHGRNEDGRTADRTATSTTGGRKRRASLSSPSTRARAGETVVEEVKKDINPPTPFKKGGSVSSFDYSSDPAAMLGTDLDRYRMVLAMWREERLAAGLDFQERERNTVKGAEMLVEEYLSVGALSADRLRQGMKKLIHDIKTDPRSKDRDLRTLAKKPTRYCPPPPIEKVKRKVVIWDFVCDVCRESFTTKPLPAGEEVFPQPCIKEASGCQGTMYPKVAMEREQ